MTDLKNEFHATANYAQKTIAADELSWKRVPMFNVIEDGKILFSFHTKAHAFARAKALAFEIQGVSFEVQDGKTGRRLGKYRGVGTIPEMYTDRHGNCVMR